MSILVGAMNAFKIFRGKVTLIIAVFVIMIGAKLVTPEFSTLNYKGLTFDGTGNFSTPTNLRAILTRIINEC